MKRAQVALEFIAMISFAGIALIVFAGLAYNIMSGNVDSGKADRIDDFGKWLQKEISLAAEVHDGYERTITLPNTIEGISYDVSIDGDTLYVSYSKGEVPFLIPQVSGSLSKGKNTIRNVGGNVQIS